MTVNMTVNFSSLTCLHSVTPEVSYSNDHVVDTYSPLYIWELSSLCAVSFLFPSPQKILDHMVVRVQGAPDVNFQSLGFSWFRLECQSNTFKYWLAWEFSHLALKCRFLPTREEAGYKSWFMRPAGKFADHVCFPANIYGFTLQS